MIEGGSALVPEVTNGAFDAWGWLSFKCNK